MTALLIALIQAILQGQSLRYKILEVADLMDFCDSERMDFVLDDLMIATLEEDPVLIPFWFLMYNRELPDNIEKLLLYHSSQTRANDIRSVHFRVYEPKIHHHPKHRELELAMLNHGKDPEENPREWTDAVDLLRHDFDYFLMAYSGEINVLSEKYHINKKKLLEAFRVR